MEDLGIATSNMEELKCLVCNKYFRYKRTLKRHSITCGSKESKNINSVQCPDSACNKTFTNKKNLKFHIEADHGVKLLNEKRTFATLHDFKEWKLKLEDDNLCFYALSARKTVGQNKTITYLDCHRTGNFQSRSTGVRKIKSQGTNKIGSTCPSSMV
ncbi:uncharacterized protein LOC126555069 [Aphis gossypii]|uniref:uncharacterized protein LOC126555069 n=1 Tax=Aphis gossypii TaxID=80765 RepID=UPI0021593FFC|nr:uncharacterized protein LOC126555069 [Aphis gossypii]